MSWFFSTDGFSLHALFCYVQCEGKIKTVALTNFDTDRLQIILENGIPIVSNQVYFHLTLMVYLPFICVNYHMVHSMK